VGQSTLEPLASRKDKMQGRVEAEEEEAAAAAAPAAADDE